MSKLLFQLKTYFCLKLLHWQKQVVLSALILMSILLSSCAAPQEAVIAKATLLAAQNSATRVALIPTSTPTSTPTATARPTATPTFTPTLSPTATSTTTFTPIPGAVVIASSSIVYAGPAKEYSQLGQYNKDEQLDIIGQFENCSWLETLSHKQSLTGWVSNARQPVQYPLSCKDIPLGTYRSLTGIIRPNQDAGGFGLLTVTNGTADDAVAILTRNGNLVTALYLRSGDNYSVNNIKDATYNLYFSTGSDWNGKEFLSSPTYQRFQDALVFTTKTTATGRVITALNFSLQTAAGGNPPVINIAKSDFPDIGN